MSIPDAVADFLERASVAIAGTRDGNLVPHVHRPSGFRVSPDRKAVVCLFAEVFAEHLPSALDDNGEIALTVSHPISHETYQLKGRLLHSGPVEDEDFENYRSCVERVVEQLGPILGSPAEVLRENVPPPTLRVVFEVREIYDQAPGPGAGRRVYASEKE